MPFVAPRSTTTTSNAGRATFRPPWVKDDTTTSSAKPTVPWAKKTTTTTPSATTTTSDKDKDKQKEKEKEKENGEKTAAKKTTTTTTAAAKKATEPAKKSTAETTKKATTEPVKRIVEPAKKVAPPMKSAEPVAIKKPTTTTKTAAAAAKKKEPTPSSSEEEEETEEESEEESEEETEEETEEEEEEESSDEDEVDNLIANKAELDEKELEKLAALSDFDVSDNEFSQPSLRLGVKLKKTPQVKKKANESELQRRFSIEKPKLRPVSAVKRDKSMKKVEDDNGAFDDNNDDNDNEETERERQKRFKLEKPKLRHVKREEKPLPNKSTDDIMKIRPVLKKVSKVDELLKEPKEQPKPEFKTKQLRKTPSIRRDPSSKTVPAPPPLPSLVPKAPPPPPPPFGAVAKDKRELSETQKAALEKLKTRPRRRPDWSEMMQEVESGKKLRHVVCNDRSQPILTCKSMTKVDDKFIYETEKANSHNKLLKQIQTGFKLKPTQTNDRSKPFIEGLRKFRKQMTIEEQIQKSQSKINLLAEAATAAVGASGTSDPAVITNSIVAALSIDEPSGDELDDIDKIRDDLQSTKQMLALELRNREAQERENKKLLAQIATLEAELEREKSREKNLEYGSRIIVATMEPSTASEEAYLNSLKQEADDARKSAKDLEKKYLDTGELLDQAKSEIEEQKSTIKMLERKLAQAMQGGGSINGSRRPSDVHGGRDSSPELDLDMSESDPDEPEEKKAERHERRCAKEVKVLISKLTKVKVKQEAAKKEKLALKQAMKKNHVILKEENKKFKKLEKEVQKMAASMKDEEEDEDADEEKDDEEAEEEEEQEESEEEEEESEESESEESEAETESESEAEDASSADKKNNLEPRVKKHESRLLAMKKCNVLLQANVDNLQDEISQVRAKAANLQSELDAVLADLGF